MKNQLSSDTKSGLSLEELVIRSLRSATASGDCPYIYMFVNYINGFQETKDIINDVAKKIGKIDYLCKKELNVSYFKKRENRILWPIFLNSFATYGVAKNLYFNPLLQDYKNYSLALVFLLCLNIGVSLNSYIEVKKEENKKIFINYNKNALISAIEKSKPKIQEELCKAKAILKLGIELKDENNQTRR